MKKIEDKYPEYRELFEAKLEPSLKKNEKSYVTNTMSASAAKRFIEFVKNDYEFTPEMKKTQDTIHDLILSK